MRLARLAAVALILTLAAACTGTNATPTPTALQPTPTSAQPTSTTSPQSTSTSAPTPTSAATESAAPSPDASPTVAPTETADPSETPGVTPPPGAFDPARVTLGVEQILNGQPPLTFLTNAGDGSGRIFVIQQRGVIVAYDSSWAEIGTFMDISERVRSGGEQGLLGVAFHPDFESNGRFFVHYTARNGNSTTSEFGLDANGNGDPASERVLFTIDDPFPNHNGGMLAFGHDGYLYLGMGDGGSGGDPLNSGQQTGTMLGKMLRIDINTGDPYGIPADNPFADGDGGLPEVWAWGLRNPWRFSFDRVTGGMFIGDVGQNIREEIDVEPAGEGGHNYGWSRMEGDRCYDSVNCNRQGLTMPAFTYGRDDGSCSVTGGYVYRGSAFPDLYGAYVFSDYCSGVLWAFDAESALESGRARGMPLGESGLSPSSFGEDEAGELYIVGHGGTINRLVATPR